MNEKLGLQFGVSWQIDEVAGPEATLTPWVDATVDTTANPWQDVYGGGTVGMNITAIQDCIWKLCLPGITLLGDNLLDGKLFDLWNNNKAFDGLVISPNVVEVAPGASTQFTATTPAGQVTSSTLTWSLVSGPGSIDKSSGIYTSPQPGIAVIQADYNGLVARAGVVVSAGVPSVPTDDAFEPTTGLVNAAVASWVPPVSGTPVSYVVTAEANGPVPAGTGNATESAVVAAPVTYAYLPNLSPGTSYQITVTAIGSDGTAVAGDSETVTPLQALPGVTAGTGSLRDAAAGPVTHDPDHTGKAGGENAAAISADGVDVFYVTESRSPQAPASVFSPASTDLYVVRELTVPPYTVTVASIGSDGSPAKVVQFSTLFASADGSVVVFAPANGNGSLLAHDFNTNASWQLNPPDLEPGPGFVAVGNNGTVAYISAATPSGTTEHVYVQKEGGTASQLDSCTATSDDGFCGQSVSMSDDGNLIAYPGGCSFNTVSGSCGRRIFLYNAATGTTKNLFAANTRNADLLAEPVLSGDGTHIAVEYAPGGVAGNTEYLVVKALDGSPVSTSDAVSTFDAVSYSEDPMSLDDNGSALVYLKEHDLVGQESTGQLKIYKNGSTYEVPQLASTFPNYARLTSDGSELFYTMTLLDFVDPYPGVYEWQTP